MSNRDEAMSLRCTILRALPLPRASWAPTGRTLRAVLWLTLGVAAGMAADRSKLLAAEQCSALPGFALIAEARSKIHQHYVDRAALKPPALTYGAISGMVDALGDTGHSVFLTPEMVKRVSRAESGQFKGIGVEIEMKDAHVVIVAPIDDSPAQRAGLRSGEIILRVDGRDTAGMTLQQVVERVSGPAGTSVRLSILDPRTDRIRDLALVRAAVRLRRVTWQRLPGTEVADVRIAAFSNGVLGDLRQALREIAQRRSTGLILDLRDNPGGVLDQAAAVASQFLTGGNVVLIRNADGKVTPVPVQPGGLAPHIPMAVLINAGSASSAEIVAGALADAHRAKLIGERTFGTGTVLNEFPLADGSALLLAVDEWLTPSGHLLWHKGISPQIAVALPPRVNPLAPPFEPEMTASALRAARDTQLLRALESLANKT